MMHILSKAPLSQTVVAMTVFTATVLGALFVSSAMEAGAGHVKFGDQFSNQISNSLQSR